MVGMGTDERRAPVQRVCPGRLVFTHACPACVRRREGQRIKGSSTGWNEVYADRVAPLLSASIHLERRDYRRAFAAVKQRYIFALPFYESTFLRLEGGLAVQLGEREVAADAYSKYLRLRSDPEPELIPERDEVRRKLAELQGEGRQ